MSKWDELKELSSDAYYFLSSFDPAQYADGRYDIYGGMYINIDSYTTRYRNVCKFEAHMKYIDVQYMISGRELITIAPLDGLICLETYDKSRDIVFYENCVEGIDFLLEEKSFLIIRPEEAHMPCVALNQPECVRKAVLKIPV